MKNDYNGPEGENGLKAIWFREGAEKPRDYDICVPHRTRKGWVVYIVFLGTIVCIIVWLVAAVAGCLQ